MPAGRFLGMLVCQPGQLPHAEGGDGIKRQTLSQVLRLVKATVLQATANFKGMEKAFNTPSSLIELHGFKSQGTSGGCVVVVINIQCKP